MSSATQNTPGYESPLDRVDVECVRIFREITGLVNLKDQAMTPESILVAPIDSFDIDSLSTMEFVMAIEDEFNVELDEKAVNKCATIGELAKLVKTAGDV